MIVGDKEFVSIGAIQPIRNNDGTITEFMPQDRYANKNNLPINKYGAGPFCKFRMAKGVRTAAVYILVRDKTPVYVGQTVNLDKRWSSNGYGGISPRNCFKGGQETNCRINNLIYTNVVSGRNFSLWFHELLLENGVLDRVELEIIQAVKPIWNKALVV